MFKPFGSKYDILPSDGYWFPWPINFLTGKSASWLRQHIIEGQSATLRPKDVLQWKPNEILFREEVLDRSRFEQLYVSNPDDGLLTVANLTIESFIKPYDISIGLFQKLRFKNVIFSRCNLDNSVIELCEFEDCIFQSCKATNTLFLGCKFSNCTFRYGMHQLQNCSFEDCKFIDCTYYRQTFFDCYFDRNTEFTGLKHLTNKTEDQSYSYLLFEEIKEGFIASKSYEEAKKFFYLAEKTYTENNEMLPKARYIRRFLDFLNGYGVKPFKIVRLIFPCLIFFSFLYFCIIKVEAPSNTYNYLQYLLLSGGAFFTFGFPSGITLGYLSGVIFILESMLGVVLTGLFLVTLSNAWTFGRRDF